LQESESLGGNGVATATFSTDVTISGPAAATIPIALNLDIAGLLGIVGPSAQTQWTATAEIGHTDFSYTTSIITGAAPTVSPLGLGFTSGGQTFPTPLSDVVSGVLTTGFVNVDPSHAVHIAISIQLLGFGNPGSVDDNFLSSLDFAKGIDVFTLPGGYTANDPDAFLFNNRFLPPSATPLPSALPLFATGLGALSLLGRRIKRRRAQLLA
jgi:hypothetical protein